MKGAPMLYLIDLFVGTISGLVVVLPFMMLFHYVTFKRRKPSDQKETVVYKWVSCAFCAALLAVFTATGVYDIYSMRIELRYDLIPFANISTNYEQYILNIILFIPIGFLLPMLSRNFKKKRLTFVTGLLLSLFIEVVQIFGLRATDVNDLLMNTAGTVIGYYVFVLMSRCFPKISTISIIALDRWKWDIWMYFVFSLLAMLFVQPFIMRWIWGLLFWQ